MTSNNPPENDHGIARQSKKLPDYFTPEEASTLVAAESSYQVQIAGRTMLQIGLR